MKTFPADYLRGVGIRLFTACGASPEEAAIVTDELIESSLMGLESHGVTRYIWYTQEVLDGKLKPGASIRVVRETPTTAVVDCELGFGAVSARHVVEIVCEKAEQNQIACAVSQNSHHVGRLGAWAQKIAERGLFGLAFANGAKDGHFVVPWGGREGRLATNPLAYAAPTSGRPIVFDMSTSMISEGKIKVLLQQGASLPPGCILDGHGNASADPKAFYGPPRGTILPFGSELGYKGFGLGLLVEILGGVLGGMDTASGHDYINGLCVIAIDPDAFCGRTRFEELMESLQHYMTSTPPAPGQREVLMPGALDFRTREQRLRDGIPLADETWRLIVETAKRVGVVVEESVI